MNKTIAIIQSRYNSKRLPGKALADINGKPMLQVIVDRVRQSKVDDVVVATTENSPQIIDYCLKNDIKFYAGSEDDILDRLYQTAIKFEANPIVLIWGDCPLISPEIIDETIELYRHQNYYVEYVYAYGIPTGLDVGVISFDRLEHYWRTLKRSEFRLWFHKYLVQNKTCVVNYYKADIERKLSVDTQEDLDWVRNEILQEVRSA